MIGRKDAGSQLFGLGMGNGEDGQMLLAKMPETLRILEMASPWEIEKTEGSRAEFLAFYF